MMDDRDWDAWSKTECRKAAMCFLALLIIMVVACLTLAGESHYVTTPLPVVVAMLDSIDTTAADVVVDLGCGDARFPIVAAVRYGCRGIGRERDPALVALARRNVDRNGVGLLVTIQEGDVLRTRWADTQKVVVLYLDTELLRKLRPVLEKLRPGSRIVSHQHAVPGWTASDPIMVGKHKIYRYRVREVTTKQKRCGPDGCTYRDVTTTVVEGF